MEDSVSYRTAHPRPGAVQPLDAPDFIGAEAALKRAAAKAMVDKVTDNSFSTQNCGMN